MQEKTTRNNPFGDVIYTYTAQDAENDGIFFNIEKLGGAWVKAPVNYITMGLLEEGYLEDEQPNGEVKIRIVNLMDLITQIQVAMRRKRDYFYKINIEFPNGTRKAIFVEQNETGKFTAMLPEER